MSSATYLKKRIILLAFICVSILFFSTRTVLASTEYKDGSVDYSGTTYTIYGDTTVEYSNGVAQINMRRTDATPADLDGLGVFDFQGQDSTLAWTVFGRVYGRSDDVTNGTEDGILFIQGRKAGAFGSIAYFHYNQNSYADGVWTDYAYDLAEDFPEKKGEALQAGEVIAVGKDMKAYRCCTPAGDTMFGVVSDHSAQLTNTGLEPDEKGRMPGYVPIALIGRVPVKVSAKEGPISIGDYLTSSSIPGVAVRATEPGPVLGRALQNFAPPEPDTVGEIIVYVSTGWYNPYSSETLKEQIDMLENEAKELLEMVKQQQINIKEISSQ